MTYPRTLGIQQHRDQGRDTVDDYTAAQDRLVHGVLTVGKGQAVLVNQAAEERAPVQTGRAGTVLDSELTVMMSDHKVALVVAGVD